MALQDLGYILETDIDVGLTTYGVQLDRSSIFGNDIIVFSCGAAAEEKAWFDHRAAFCCSNSARNFCMATARKPEVFSRSIPCLYSVFEYQAPQKSRTMRAL